MSRSLAKRYVAIVRGGSLGGTHRHTIADRNKQQAFRGAKRHVVAWYADGATVELRAGTTRGPILERVRLTRAGSRHRWVQDFET